MYENTETLHARLVNDIVHENQLTTTEFIFGGRFGIDILNDPNGDR